jgi:molecular chaperone DnaK
MKEQIEKLNQIAHTIAQAMYAKSTPDENADGGDQAPGDGTGGGSDEKDEKSDDDVVDAEFEDIGKK